jgi:hypothetical protein
MVGWLVLVVMHVKRIARRDGKGMKFIYNTPVERLMEGKSGYEGMGIYKEVSVGGMAA